MSINAKDLKEQLQRGPLGRALKPREERTLKRAERWLLTIHWSPLDSSSLEIRDRETLAEALSRLTVHAAQRTRVMAYARIKGVEVSAEVPRSHWPKKKPV